MAAIGRLGLEAFWQVSPDIHDQGLIATAQGAWSLSQVTASQGLSSLPCLQLMKDNRHPLLNAAINLQLLRRIGHVRYPELAEWFTDEIRALVAGQVINTVLDKVLSDWKARFRREHPTLTREALKQAFVEVGLALERLGHLTV